MDTTKNDFGFEKWQSHNTRNIQGIKTKQAESVKEIEQMKLDIVVLRQKEGPMRREDCKILPYYYYTTTLFYNIKIYTDTHGKNLPEIKGR